MPALKQGITCFKVLSTAYFFSLALFGGSKEKILLAHVCASALLIPCVWGVLVLKDIANVVLTAFLAWKQ